MSNKITFKKIDNDINGVPRYVCHFLALNTEAEKEKAVADQKAGLNTSFIDALYRLAVAKAKVIGGKKFHNKQYGGGIVFQSYNLNNLEATILNLNK